MSVEYKTSPYRRHRNDFEAGSNTRRYDKDEDEDEDCGPFDIVRTKGAPVDRLRRWRQAALVLNASRRFRYTLDLNKEEERKQVIAKIRMHAQVIRAAVLFQAAGQGQSVTGSTKPPSRPTQISDFNISSEELVAMNREHELSLLQQSGGVNGIADKLKSYVEKGVTGDESDLINRKKAFGSNTYPRKKGRGFWRLKMTTLINRIQEYVSQFVQLANHDNRVLLWAPIGSAAVTLFAWFWFNDYNWGKNKKIYSTILSGVLGGLFLILGFVLRETNLMRRRVGLLWSTVFTLIVGVIACVINVIHTTPKSAIIGQMLLGVYIFTLVEISKPTQDFGLSQFFFLMPFLTTCNAYPKHVVSFHFYSGFMYLFGTVWNIVMLHHFERAYNARQATGKVGIGNEGIAQEVGIGNEGIAQEVGIENDQKEDGVGEVGTENGGIVLELEELGDAQLGRADFIAESFEFHSARRSFDINDYDIEQPQHEADSTEEYFSTYTCVNHIDIERGELMRPCSL